MEYNFSEIEKKWRHYWKENKTYNVTEDSDKEKYYVLDMFPYPSGAWTTCGTSIRIYCFRYFCKIQKVKGIQCFASYGL